MHARHFYSVQNVSTAHNTVASCALNCTQISINIFIVMYLCVRAGKNEQNTSM